LISSSFKKRCEKKALDLNSFGKKGIAERKKAKKIFECDKFLLIRTDVWGHEIKEIVNDCGNDCKTAAFSTSSDNFLAEAQKMFVFGILQETFSASFAQPFKC
jgi:hypothetical protein